MTREEAIDFNKNLKMYMKISDKSNPCKFLEENYVALDMAIKALEQEPCEDAISRQAVLDIDFKRICLTTAKPAEMIRSRINDLSPVQPKPKTGYWIYDEEYSDWCEVTYRCSCCERALVVLYEARNEVYKDYPYCHCGAKMESEGEECQEKKH